MKTERNAVKRAPKRGIYDQKTICELLDKDFLCHVGVIYEGRPIVIPTMYGRDGDKIYLHGASVSRLMTTLEQEVDLSISVANVSGLVLARSAFHHSLNYESVVVFGKGKLVDEDRKVVALKTISDHLIKGRWEESRLPNQTELKATKVIEINLSEASAKVRTGPPSDEKKDYELDVWAEVIPIVKKYGTPIADPKLKEGISIPDSVRNIL